MSESNGANMICPKCGQFQEKADTCNACGIVIAKVRGEQTVTKTQTEDTAQVESQPPVAPRDPRQRLIIPMISLGVILIGIGATMLINKLTGGSLNYGTMRHLGWFLIPFISMIGVGCVGQALEWKADNS